MEDDKSVKDFPISPLPKKTAIVIDKNTASSAETLIRYAKMCCDTTRTKVYGKENGFFGLQTNYSNSQDSLFFFEPVSRYSVTVENYAIPTIKTLLYLYIKIQN